jgi:hypothetical protein
MHAVKNKSQEPSAKDQNRAAIKLWRAKLPLMDIRNQLDMSESTLRTFRTVPDRRIQAQQASSTHRCEI